MITSRTTSHPSCKTRTLDHVITSRRGILPVLVRRDIVQTNTGLDINTRENQPVRSMCNIKRQQGRSALTRVTDPLLRCGRQVANVDENLDNRHLLDIRESRRHAFFEIDLGDSEDDIDGRCTCNRRRIMSTRAYTHCYVETLRMASQQDIVHIP